MLAHRALVITSAARNNAPAVYNASDFVREGGLLSYGRDPVDLFRRAATYVDRILRGEKPGDLPQARLIWPGQVCPAATRTSLRRGGAAGFARSAFRFAEFSCGSPPQAAFGGLGCTYSRTQCCCYLSMSLAPPAPPPLRGAFLRSAGKLPQRCLGDLRCSSGRAPAGVFTMLDGGLIVTLMLSAGAIAFAVLALRPEHKGGRASTR